MNRVLIPLITLCVSCNRNKPETTQPVRENITESVYATGTVRSNNQYEVFSTVSGIISKYLAEEGALVKKGDPIVVLVNETGRLYSENARISAQYSSAGLNADRLKEMAVNIELALSRMRTDSALFQRRQNLWGAGIGTRNELEQSELAFKNSSTAYQAALLRYNELKRQIDFEARQSLKNWQIANQENSDYTIKARQNGKVYHLAKEPGEIVSPQTPIAIIGDDNSFLVELEVDEYDIGKIRTGQSVYLNMDSYQGQVFEGTVKWIQPIMDNRTRSFKVEADFISRPSHLYPNLTVEANILIATKTNAITIPRSYLVDEQYVLLSNGEKRKVVTGIKDYQRVEIISGLDHTGKIRKPSK